jgi:transmembrane sensor
VEVTYEERSLEEMKFSGTISRYENVSKLLDMLETTGLVKFKAEGNKIIVSKL